MRVYLDTCSLQRPLDSRTHIRITLEAEAVIGIIGLLEAEEIELVSSEALLFEVGRNPIPERRDYALAVLTRASDSFNRMVTLKTELENFRHSV